MLDFSVILKNASKLSIPLLLPCIDGAIPLLVATNSLTFSTAPGVALSVLAGPAAVLTAATMEGETKARLLSAFIAGIIATIAVVIAAFIGEKLTAFLNIQVLRVFVAIAICLIALEIGGIKIPHALPLAVVILGFILSLYLNFS